MSRVLETAVIAALGMAGCSITPSQEDVTGIKTSVLARKLACEARFAGYKMMGLYLANQTNDSAAAKAGLAIRDDIVDPTVDDIRRVDFRGLKPATASAINKYLDTAVAFDFTLDGLEVNNASLGIIPFRSFQRGSRSLETSFHIDRSRQNIQSFTDSFTLRELIFKKDPRWCAIKNYGPNYVYPIAGEVGIFDKLFEFVEMSEFVNLGAASSEKSGPPAMSFNMKFTTKISGNVAPTITLAPVVGMTRTGTAINLDGERTDTHTLILAFARGDLTVPDSEFSGALAGQFVAPVSNRAQQQARIEIGRNILRQQVNNSAQPTIVYQSLIPFF